MKITSTYSVRLRNFNRVFDDTVEVYRHAVDYFIELVMANWNTHFAISVVPTIAFVLPKV